MFGLSGQIEEDEDVNDNWSCPSTYKHFNASVKPKSKLGRRRLVPKKDENVQDNKHCHNGDSLKQPQLNTKQSQCLQRDDSGFLTSDSTPSLTHPVSNTGTLFRNHSKPEENPSLKEFTPSFKSARENVFFDKFLLPTTPCRPMKSEPLKELIGINNVINNSSSNCSGSSLVNELVTKEGSNIQKQLNSSFICDESLQSMNSGDLQQQLADASKIPSVSNNSDVSNDSSFMTAQIYPPENQTNKTVYDHEFLKTPGKNLAEIRIEESPFNPLEEYLEDSDDFAECDSKTPLPKSHDSCANLPPQQAQHGFDGAGPKTSLVAEGVENSDTGPIAIPLANESSEGMGSWDFFGGAKHQNEIKSTSHPKENHFREVSFKHPAFGFGTPQIGPNKMERYLNSSDVGNLKSLEAPSTDIVQANDKIDETSNVTYPQHSRNNYPPKNSFTSQFSINHSSNRGNMGYPANGKALSLACSVPSRPLSAASCPSTKGVISNMGAMSNPLNTSCAERAAAGSVVVHQQNNLEDANNSRIADNRISSWSSRPDSVIKRQVGNHSIQESNNAFDAHQRVNNSSAQDHGNDQLDGSITWISCVKTPKACGLKDPDSKYSESSLRSVHKTSSKLHEDHNNVSSSLPLDQDMETVVLNETTVVARNDHVHKPAPHLSAPHATPIRSGAIDGAPPVQNTPATSDKGSSVMSALIKPQPENVITIKGIQYTVLSLLGTGGSSQVYQVMGPQSSKLMAIKCVNLAKAEKAMAMDYLNEIALLSKLQGCPSVIKMIDCEYIEQSQMLYVALEKGDIDFSKLIKNITETKRISMSMIVYYWTEMLNAVLEIHKRGIIHSDLKPANFLLVEGRLKLIDFGIASSIQGDTTSVMKEVPAGTYNYMSPEAIRGPKITRKSDVWSMGCILYNLLYGRTPYAHLNHPWQKIHAIADPNHKVTFPKLQLHTPPSLRLALRWCLIKDPTLRPTVEELVQLSELSPHVDSCLGKEIDGMMCKYFRKVIPNLKILQEEEDLA